MADVVLLRIKLYHNNCVVVTMQLECFSIAVCLCLLLCWCCCRLDAHPDRAVHCQFLQQSSNDPQHCHLAHSAAATKARAVERILQVRATAQGSAVQRSASKLESSVHAVQGSVQHTAQRSASAADCCRTAGGLLSSSACTVPAQTLSCQRAQAQTANCQHRSPAAGQ